MEDENTMNITSARLQAPMVTYEQPTTIQAVIDGVAMSVPLDPRNSHYKEILRQVEAGILTIQEA
jgi:hypothetical protein